MIAATLAAAYLGSFKPRTMSRSRSNRISSLGYRCVRRLTWDRLIGDLRKPIAPERAGIFAEGDLHEQAARRDLSRMGIDLIHVQREVVGPHNISGHLDGVIVQDGKEVVVEIKSMHPALWDKHQTLADMVNSSSPWTAAYPTQLCMYEHGIGTDSGVFILRNKSTGQLRFIDCPRDESLVGAAIARAAAVEEQIALLLPFLAPERDRLAEMAGLAPNMLPPATPDNACQYCDYRGWACDLLGTGGSGVVVETDEALLADAETVRLLAPQAQEHEAATSRLKAAFKSRGAGVYFAGPVCAKVTSYMATKDGTPKEIKAQYARKEEAFRVTLTMEE